MCINSWISHGVPLLIWAEHVTGVENSPLGQSCPVHLFRLKFYKLSLHKCLQLDFCSAILCHLCTCLCIFHSCACRFPKCMYLCVKVKFSRLMHCLCALFVTFTFYYYLCIFIFYEGGCNHHGCCGPFLGHLDVTTEWKLMPVFAVLMVASSLMNCRLLV